MPAISSERHRFLYPENWSLERDDHESGWSVSVQSPDTAFLTVSFHADARTRPARRHRPGALRAEYPDLEAEPQVETIAGQPAVGHDVQFFSLDLTNTAWIRGVPREDGTRARAVPGHRPGAGPQRAGPAGDLRSLDRRVDLTPSRTAASSASRAAATVRVDLLLGVRRRNERRLELAARQVDAAVHHRPEEPGEPRRVALLRGVVVGDRRRR